MAIFVASDHVMAKVLDCGDVFPGCPERITGATEQEVMTQQAAHCLRAHDLPGLPPELQRKIVAKIRTRNAQREGLEDAVVAWAPSARPSEPRALVSSGLLAALKKAGTTRLYVDTAEPDGLRDPGGAIVAEVDGATVNPPLVRRVLGDHRGARLAAAAAHVRELGTPRGSPAFTASLYTLVAGSIGRDLSAAVGGGRALEVSLQLPMEAARQPDLGRSLGRALHRIVPACLVTVPFIPDAPQCVLVARDLRRHGIPVNVTSMFSARQVVAVALLTGAEHTSIFMGGLNEGLGADLVSEHAVREAQRALERLRRREAAVRTRLVVASLRDWRTLVRVAGADALTAPPCVLRDFQTQRDVAPGDVANHLDRSYEDRLGLAPGVTAWLGRARIDRLWRVEPEFVEFLRAFAGSAEYSQLRDHDQLVRRFRAAGFGDFFCHPTPSERLALREGTLPDLASSPRARTFALDTLSSLLSDADLDREQQAIDADLAGGRSPG